MGDYFRLPKRQWYWYRNEYLHIPPPAWPGNGVPAALKLTADKTTLNSVDGTDDAQLVLTVVDSDGKPISNCPPVTLAIESGPGEFPTGPSITFAPDSLPIAPTHALIAAIMLEVSPWATATSFVPSAEDAADTYCRDVLFGVHVAPESVDV